MSAPRNVRRVVVTSAVLSLLTAGAAYGVPTRERWSSHILSA